MRCTNKHVLEKDIQRGIMDLLCIYGINFWRQNQGNISINDKFGMPTRRFMAARDQRGRAVKGISDIIGILNDGKFLAIEVKRPGNKPTPDQITFIENINKNNGLAFVAYSVDDVQNILRREGYVK
tara:strand:+ start:2207 stop:2584 length:378 start_codon:yes stop_codon:yes gene_type:complete